MANGFLTGQYGKGTAFAPRYDYRSSMPQFTDQAVDLAPEVIAEAVCYALAQPENVDVSDLVVRPSRESDPRAQAPGEMGGNHVYSLSYVCLPGWEDRRGLFAAPEPPLPWRPTGPFGRTTAPGHSLRHHHHAGWLCRRPGPPPAPAGPPGQGGLCEPPGPADGPVCGLGGPQGVFGLSGPVLERKGRPAAHVIQAVTEQVDPAYLTYLRQVGGVPSSPGRSGWTAPCRWRSWRPGSGSSG